MATTQERTFAGPLLTGVGLAGADFPDDIALAQRRERPPADPGDYDPAPLIGARGYRYKDRATKLALVAARRALIDAGLVDAEAKDAGAGDDRTAVVVSSNFGNLETVCSVADTIREHTVTGTSPMDLPNASSNVIASTIAIRFGLRGPNVMVCNGASSGLDAIAWGRLFVQAGRADRALIVGVESANPVVQRLAGSVVDGAAAVVIESSDSALLRGRSAAARLDGYARAADAAAATAAVGATTGTVLDTDDLVAGSISSGALGLLQCVTAVQWLRGAGSGSVLALAGGPDDGVAALVIRAAA